MTLFRFWAHLVPKEAPSLTAFGGTDYDELKLFVSGSESREDEGEQGGYGSVTVTSASSDLSSSLHARSASKHQGLPTLHAVAPLIHFLPALHSLLNCSLYSPSPRRT